MTVAMCREEKEHLEAEIKKLLNEFSEKTGLRVAGIAFVQQDMLGSIGYVIDVEVEVTL